MKLRNQRIKKEKDLLSSNTKPFHCSVCEYSGATKQCLAQHVRTHSTDKPFKSLECSYRTNHKTGLKRHVFHMHNKNPNSRKKNFTCQICSNAFHANSTLKAHMLTHTQIKSFSCQFCARAFARKGDTKSHEITCAKNPKTLADQNWIESQMKFDCNFCSFKAMTQRQLTPHMRTHTQEKPFKCSQCDYAAASFSSVRCHTSRKHNTNRVKIIPCQLCPQMFYTKPELYRHIPTHTLEKPWECKFCNRQFAQSSTRGSHYKVCKLNSMQSDPDWVQKQKRFKCELCEYSSIARYKIKRHLKTHTGERAFKCEFCKYTCSESYELNRHIRTHTREKPFKCPYCPYHAVSSTAIADHIKRPHPTRRKHYNNNSC